jgi:hypothetical protein
MVGVFVVLLLVGVRFKVAFPVALGTGLAVQVAVEVYYWRRSH